MRYKKRTLDGRPTFRASALPQGLNPVKRRHGGEHQIRLHKFKTLLIKNKLLPIKKENSSL